MGQIASEKFTKPKVTFFLCFSFLLILAILPSALAATVQGTVTSVEAKRIELSVGSDKGLKEGNTGRVYYMIEIGPEKKSMPIHVARFKITHISQKSSMATIEDKTADIEVGYLVEVTIQATAQEPPPKVEEKKPPPQTVVKKKPQPGEVWKDPHLGMEFVWVPGGCYEMGDLWGDGDKNEKPVHTVCVDGFWMGRYEVTQGQWRRLMGDNPSHFKSCGNNCPVEKVSWNEAVEFARRLSQKAGYTFRLPTEAEWEYACRSGGKKEKYSGGDNVDAVAWYGANSGLRNHPVGGKRSNGLGIYDMSGNVWEWCGDWYSSDYYGRSPKDNPQGPSSGEYRVLRGGSWNDNGRNVRCANRLRGDPGNRGNAVGFRLVRVARQ